MSRGVSDTTSFVRAYSLEFAKAGKVVDTTCLELEMQSAHLAAIAVHVNVSGTNDQPFSVPSSQPPHRQSDLVMRSAGSQESNSQSSGQLTHRSPAKTVVEAGLVSGPSSMKCGVEDDVVVVTGPLPVPSTLGRLMT